MFILLALPIKYVFKLERGLGKGGQNAKHGKWICHEK